MKSSSLFLVVGLGATATEAFVPMTQPAQTSVAPSTSSSSLSATRRNFLETSAAAAAAAMILGPTAASAEPRPMYLTDPTEEFKENEAKSAEFKRQQIMAKKEFSAALDKLLSEANDTDALVKDVKDIQALVAKTGGMPLGIKKEDMYKLIRAKKAKGYWPTPVEVAYQSLIQEVAFQQSPNVEKDLGNFYQ